MSPSPAGTRPAKMEKRLAVLQEAHALEVAGGDWSAVHVGAVAGCAVSTVYDTAWMMRVSRPVGSRGRRWIPSEFRREQAIVAAQRQRNPRAGFSTFRKTGS